MTSSPDLSLALVKMVLALAFMLALIWGLSRLARRKLSYGRNTPATGLIQILESRYLGVKKSITVVKVPGSVLVLGLGADRINLLTRIDNPDLISSLAAVDDTKSGMSFKDHFQRLTRNLGAKEQSTGSLSKLESL